MTPRGIRNNNPLNIRRNGTAWSGLSAQQTDRSFCQFRNMAYGFRAAFITIHTYIFKHGLGTISQIISRWDGTHISTGGSMTEGYERAMKSLQTRSPSW